MKRKFECLKCHHQFEADDQKEVTCPKCGSDNIRPVGKKVVSILAKIGLFIIAVIVGYYGVKLLKGSNTNDDEGTAVVGVPEPSSYGQNIEETEIPQMEGQEKELDPEIQKEQEKIEKQAEKVKVPQPVTLAYTSPKASKEGTYSFKATAEHLPSGVTVIEFIIQSIIDNSVIASSKDGKFSGVPYSPNRGQYNLLASLSDGQSIKKDHIGGFDEIKVVDNRMKAEELSALLNQLDKNLGLGKNPKVVRKPTIVVNDTQNENNRNIKIIDDIYGRLELGAWESVIVTSVEYDSHGRINKFYIDYKE